MTVTRVALVVTLAASAACSPAYDTVIRGGTIYDGKGGAPVVGDVAISGDSIVAVGTVSGKGKVEIVAKGLSTNVASFVGATTVRINVIGWDDRAPTPVELERMQALVKQAMEEGALGVGSSLIYTPAIFAKTDELIALMKTAAPYGGM